MSITSHGLMGQFEQPKKPNLADWCTKFRIGLSDHANGERAKFETKMRNLCVEGSYENKARQTEAASVSTKTGDTACEWTNARVYREAVKNYSQH